MPSTIFLTGATGFVGRSTVPRLAADGHAIRALTRDTTALGPGATPVRGAMEQVGSWSPALSGVDTVVHLAARVHVMRERSADPLSAFRAVNRDATLDLAEASAKA